jgi:hypothetical protein
MDFVPDSQHLAQIFGQAQAPAFMLAAIIGFISVLRARLKDVRDQFRDEVKEASASADQAAFRESAAHLKRRVMLLHSSIYLALGSGVSTTLLLAILFTSAFLKLQHVYGGGLLFAVSSALLALSLYKFAREISLGLKDMERF